MLNTVCDNKGSRHKSKRVGRGIGSGKGKTCGKGHKGQKARSGVAIKGFEGGQMPIFRRLPKVGFKSRRVKPVTINIKDIIDSNKFSEIKLIDKQVLVDSGLIRSLNTVVKFIGNQTFKTAINIEVDKASQTVIKNITEAGGKVKLLK